MTIKTIFLDRDGVINKETGYLYKIDECEFIEGIFEACRQFRTLGYQIIIVTNQSGISRNYFSEVDFQKITDWMFYQFEKENINILDIFHCPHLDADNCNCRKPKPGMFITAKTKHNINMKKSWMIGDNERDIKAANKAGINKTILIINEHKDKEANSNAMFCLGSISQVSQVLLEN